MRSILGSILIALSASQVSALSCNFGNTAAAWEEAEQTGADFVTVQGRFSLPDAWRLFEEEDYVLEASFDGFILNPDGSIRPYKTQLNVFGACINGDCGYLSAGEYLLTFIYDPQNNPVTYSMPCSGFPMFPSDEVRSDLLSCMNDGPCEAATFY